MYALIRTRHTGIVEDCILFDSMERAIEHAIDNWEGFEDENMQDNLENNQYYENENFIHTIMRVFKIGD